MTNNALILAIISLMALALLTMTDLKTERQIAAIACHVVENMDEDKYMTLGGLSFEIDDAKSACERRSLKK